MQDDEIQRLAASGLGLLAIAAFGLFAGGTLLFDIALPVGRQLALVGAGIGAVSGVALLVSNRRGNTTAVENPLFTGTQLSMFASIVLWNTSTVDHPGFRGMFLASGAGILFFGFLLVLAALLGPDRVAWLDESNGELE